MPTAQEKPPRPNLARFLAAAVSQLGAPYIWNAKGEYYGIGSSAVPLTRAFDCSGLVTWAYREAGGPDWRATHNTDVLFAQLPHVPMDALQPGDLLFWGTPEKDGVPADTQHVAIYLGGSTALLSAAGGGRTTRTIEDSYEAKAYVRTETSIHYRAGFLGARRLHWSE
jgi:murein DD-endopeptidase